MHLRKARIVINLGTCIAAGIISFSTPAMAEDQGVTVEQQTEIQTQETQAPETQTPETQAPETQTPETQAPETQTPETQVPETQAPETQVPETQAPEILMTETPTPETQISQVQIPEAQPDSATGTETEDSRRKSKDTESSGQEKTSSEEQIQGQTYYSPYSSNEELLAHQNIVSASKLYRPMFSHVEAESIILKAGTIIHEGKGSETKQIGIARDICTAYMIADKDSEWLYIESGAVRGFTRKDSVISGKASEVILRRNANEISQQAEALVPYYDNTAFLYSMDTAQDVKAKKICALAPKEVIIYDGMDFGSAVAIGKLPKNAIAYILKDEGGKVFVESGSVRGFANKGDLVTGHIADAAENVMQGYIPEAEELVKPGDNKAYYYTLTYVTEPDTNTSLRASIVDFALQFVGNPYVWGGTSLTNGTDCSGFVQSIYANFGYSLPRVASDQACYGKQIPIDCAQPGDLIFYAKNGYVYHVSMYIGDGQVVQAYSTSAGIITSEIADNAVWATTIL